MVRVSVLCGARAAAPARAAGAPRDGRAEAADLSPSPVPIAPSPVPPMAWCAAPPPPSAQRRRMEVLQVEAGAAGRFVELVGGCTVYTNL